ncbi:MAG: ATP-dependent sacrificial sulfur transferase LarE [Clostridia bacterium]|nr:ATP-dependent sacrificial sulfur transferase LarE [Clostridia bacterium]
MELNEFFRQNRKVAVAFSGGADSAYLLYAAKQNGANVTAYTVKTAFQPAFELADAKRLAAELDVPLRVLELDILSDPAVVANPADRCYHCKRRVFTAITKAAWHDGYELLLDGTNASDDAGDRPGMRALKELSVRSPLRECGLTKPEIRALSKAAGLFTWDKPAYACLATRIAAGEPITAEKLARTEQAENYLFSRGFSDFRVRSRNETAVIQLREEQFPLFAQHRKEIAAELRQWYGEVLLDTEGRV